MKQPRKRKPPVVWGVVDKHDNMSGDEAWKDRDKASTYAESDRREYPDFAPFRVVRFVEDVK